MIYVLFSCDANKNWSSMRMLGASTNLLDIKKELQRMIKTEEVEFNQERFNPNDTWRVYDLNTEFEYVHIEEVQEGEFVN